MGVSESRESHCPNCGNEIDPYANVCWKCRHVLLVAEESPQTEASPKEAPVDPARTDRPVITLVFVALWIGVPLLGRVIEFPNAAALLVYSVLMTSLLLTVSVLLLRSRRSKSALLNGFVMVFGSIGVTLCLVALLASAVGLAIVVLFIAVCSGNLS